MKVKSIFKGKNLEIFKVNEPEKLIIPVIQEVIKAGSGYSSFESPALDFPETGINLYDLLIKDRDCTVFAIATGDCLNDIAIFNGDIMIIDRSLEVVNNDIIVVYVDGDFYVKRFKPKYTESNQLKSLKLKPENKGYYEMEITPENEMNVLGVVTWSLHKHR